MLKNIKIFNIIIKKKNLKNISNILDFEIKQKKKNYVDNKKEINKIKKVYYLFYLLLSKVYK